MKTDAVKNLGNFHYMILIALLGYRINDCLTKFILTNLSVFEAMFYRSLLTLILIPFLLYFTKIDLRLFLDPKVFFRNFLAAIALFFEVAALDYLSLGTFVLLSYTAPVFAKILARLFLKENLETFDFLLMGISLLGTGLIVDSSLGNQAYMGVIFALLGAFFYAASMVASRTLVTKDFTSIYFTYIVLIFCMSAFKWPTVLPIAKDFVMLFVMAGIHIGAFILSLKGLMSLKTSHAAILEYSGLIFAIALDYSFWGIMPSHLQMTGGTLIVLAVLASIYRKNLLVLIQKG